jgi:two-component system NarL family response regulator
MIQPEARSILLVDDQVEFLELLRGRLERSPGLAVVGEATSGQHALDLLGQLNPAPDVALVDVEMPVMDGFVTARKLRGLAPSLKVVLISASADAGYARLAASVGAVFLAKRDLSAEAILRLLDGDHQR